MIKSFLILINLWIFLFSSEQIILVVADDFNTSKAQLQCFENNKSICGTIDVNIGKNGLGWGLGKIVMNPLTQDPYKFEGDKKAPIGVFNLSSVFGYPKEMKLNMKYIHASKNLICIDESSSINYNKIIYMAKNRPKSFEYMKRDDSQYELGIVVEHNTNAISKRGSCIFIHVQKNKSTGTAGCTSMKLKNLKKIVSWLDKDKKPILVQIPKSVSRDVLQLYPQLSSSSLLKQQ